MTIVVSSESIIQSSNVRRPLANQTASTTSSNQVKTVTRQPISAPSNNQPAKPVSNSTVAKPNNNSAPPMSNPVVPAAKPSTSLHPLFGYKPKVVVDIEVISPTEARVGSI
jgi:hypothetical protein